MCNVKSRIENIQKKQKIDTRLWKHFSSKENYDTEKKERLEMEKLILSEEIEIHKKEFDELSLEYIKKINRHKESDSIR